MAVKAVSGTIFSFLFGVLIAGVDLPIALADDPAIKTSPTVNDGRKWKIAYYEGGPYDEYKKVFIALISGLMELGWIEKTPLPEYPGESTLPLWEWLSNEAQSDYLEFLADGYQSADWVEAKRSPAVAQLLPRLQSANGIDLLMAMGTVAGQDFANDLHATPTIILATTDPVGAGVIPGEEDSGYDHVHATVNSTRFERQVRVFHDAVGFQTLGMLLENSTLGRSYSGISSVKKIASERGFSINQCYITDELASDVATRNQSAISCFEELAQQSDAIYVTSNLGINAETMPRIVDIAHAHQLPTFSQMDSAEVEQGLLLSLSQANFKYIGEFHAAIIAQVLNGIKPGHLSLKFQDPIKLAMNMKTAEVIGFVPPAAILAATDEMYFEIGSPE